MSLNINKSKHTYIHHAHIPSQGSFTSQDEIINSPSKQKTPSPTQKATVPQLKLSLSNLPNDDSLPHTPSHSSPKQNNLPSPRSPVNEIHPLRIPSQRSTLIRRSTRKYSSRIQPSFSEPPITPPRKRPKCFKKVDKFLDSTPIIIIMSILTIFTLFASDIQIAWLPITVDEPFNIIQCILLAIFGIEFILNSIVKEGYFLHFFFWLDLIATISLVQDIDYVMNPIMGYEPVTVFHASMKNVKGTQKAAKAVEKVSKASRATRVLRVIRIVRLIRMVKLYKSVVIAREKAEKDKQDKKKRMLMMKLDKENSGDNRDMSSSTSRNESAMGGLNDNNEGNENNGIVIYKKHSRKRSDLTTTEPQTTTGDINEQRESNYPTHRSSVNMHERTVHEKRSSTLKRTITMKENNSSDDEFDMNDSNELLIKESKISKLITESITKKVIVLILALLIIFPLLSDDFYSDSSSSITYSLLSEYLSNNYHIHQIQGFIDTSILNLEDFFDKSFPAVNITINGVLYYENAYLKNFTFRYRELQSTYSEDATVHVVYSIRKETILGGELNLAQTLFVCICLTISAILFERDATSLVLDPLEVMIEIVEKVAKDPINAKNIDELQTGVKAAIHNINQDNTKTRKQSIEDSYEIQIIKGAIIKISALLAIGFGEAGGEIIQKNLESGRELNPRLKGKKKTAIFGFCDIHNFNDINIALEEKSILFVNEIADIVHSSVDKFKGAINKNIGDAFLSVWKFYNEITIKGKTEPQRKDNLLDIDPTNPRVSIIADCAILSFLRVILKINKNLSILSYNTNPSILSRIPNFKLKMGFGLHMGYGIEGAVGSTYKIDASYLSPNVNIAARLESASRQFGVYLLISGPLYKLLSTPMKQLCRYVDCVTVKGSELPLDLYTIDVNDKVSPQKEVKMLFAKERRMMYNEKKLAMEVMIEEYGNVTKVVMEKSSFRELIKVREEAFVDSWNKGIEMYRKGDWKSAKMFFNTCRNIDEEDGPVRTLMEFINRNKGQAPQGWNGVRELVSK